MKKAIGRAILHLLRTPLRSMGFASALFLLLLMIAVCLTIQAGTRNNLADIRDGLGKEVVLTPNFSAAGSNHDTAYVTEELGRKLAKSSYVTNFNFYAWASASASLKSVTSEYSDNVFKISPISGMETNQADSPESSSSYYITADKKEGNSQKTNEAGVKTGFILKGYSDLNLESNFYNKHYILTEGSFFKDGDIGGKTAPAVISRQLADRNGLKPGSAFYIQIGGDSKEKGLRNGVQKMAFRVAGIFETDESNDGNVSYMVDMNSIFVPLKTVKSILNFTDTEKTGSMLRSVTYFLDRASHINSFRKEAAEYGMDENAYSLDARDSEYELAAGPFKRLGMLSIILMIFAAAAATALIVIPTVRSLKGRRGEIVLLRTAGTGIRTVSFQFTMELFLLLILAAASAGIAGNILSEPAAKAIMNQQARLYETLGEDKTITTIAVKTDKATSANTGNKAFLQYGSHLQTDTLTESSRDWRKRGLSVSSEGALLLYVLGTILILLCGIMSQTVYLHKFEPIREVFGKNAGSLSHVQAERLSDAFKSCGLAFLKGRIYAITGQIRETGPILLMHMAGLIEPNSGRSRFANTSARENNKTGLVLKNCPVIPYLSVLDNAMLSLNNTGPIKAKVLELLARAGIDPLLISRKASALNQADQQVLAIVRAIAAKPQLMLIEAGDWSSCPEIEKNLFSLLGEFAHEDGNCVVMATDSRIYAGMADEIWGFKDGILLPLKIS